MHPDNRNKLRDRVVRAAEAALAESSYVAPVDVLTGIGWLPASALAVGATRSARRWLSKGR